MKQCGAAGLMSGRPARILEGSLPAQLISPVSFLMGFESSSATNPAPALIQAT